MEILCEKLDINRRRIVDGFDIARSEGTILLQLDAEWIAFAFVGELARGRGRVPGSFSKHLQAVLWRQEKKHTRKTKAVSVNTFMSHMIDRSIDWLID